MILLDQQGRFLFANELYRKIFGIDVNDVPGVSFTQSMPTEDLESFLYAVEECSNSDCTVNLDLRNERKDGSIFWTRWEFFRVRDDEMPQILLQGIGYDITERKRAEEEKLFANRSLQIILDNTEECFIVTNTELDIVSYNTRAADLTKELAGAPLKQGLPLLMFLRGLEEPEFEKLFRKALDGIPQENEVHAVTLEGRDIVFANTFRPLKNERDDITGVIFTSREITAKKAVENALHQSEEKYRMLFQNNPQPMWLYDPATLRFLEVNEAAIKHYGYSWNEFMNMSIKDIRPAEDLPLLIKQLENVKELEGAIPNDKVWRHKKKNGEVIYVEIKSHFVTYQDRRAGFVSVNDITKMIETEQALKTSNERFEMAGRATSDAIWDVDFQKETLHWGKGFEKLFGHKSEIQDHWEDSWIKHIYVDDRQKVLANFNRIVFETQETFWSDEYKFYKNGGELCNVIDKGIIVRDEKGRPLRMIGAMQDITEQKRSEERLARERNLLRTLIDHIPDLIFVKDTTLKHVIVNRALVETMEIGSEEKAVGKSLGDLIGPSALAYEEYDKQVLETGKSIELAEHLVSVTVKGPAWYNTTLIPLKENGKVIGLVGISRDITERKKIEESLRERNEIYQIITEATNDTIYDVDLLSGRTQWNDSLFTNFGYKLRETDLAWWRERMEPFEFNQMMETLEYNYANRISPWQHEMNFLAANGEFKPIYSRGYIMYDDDGRPFRMLGSLVDLSEITKLKEQLQEEKVLKQREITEATIQAQEKERTEIGRELHDNINQILTTTKLYIDLAMHEPDFVEEMLRKSYNNISTAIDEIRALSKSLVPPSLGDIGIKEAIREMISNLQHGGVRIDFVTDQIEELYLAPNLELMVFRIIQEQVNNIIKHSKASRAEIKLSGYKKMLNITIRDNGVGFDTAKKKKGIGLNNITSRAELHNGTVDVISNPGEGCILKVAIPIK